MSDSEDDASFQLFQAGLPEFQLGSESVEGTALAGRASHALTSKPAIPIITDDLLADVLLDQTYATPNLQNFYEGPRKCSCCPNWTEKPPLQPPEHARSKYEAAAIILFHRKDHEAERAVVGGLIKTFPWAIEIQSQILNEILRPILDKLGPKADKEKKLRIETPFHTLFFAYPEVQSILDRETDWMRRTHIELLLHVMDDLFKDISTEVKALHSKKMITYKYLWTLFPRDIIVVSTKYGPDRLFRVAEYRRGVVDSEFMQFNGVSFRKLGIRIQIPGFAGARLIDSLPVYPVGFHHDSDLEERVYKRALKVLKIQRSVLLDHKGWAVASSASPVQNGARLLSGRVMIDAFGMEKYASLSMIRDENGDALDYLSDSDSEDPARSDERAKTVAKASNEIMSKRRLNVAQQERNFHLMLEKRESVLIVSPYLPGYSMNQNQWMWFYIEDLRLVRWNENAYKDLVYDEDYKTILRNCVQHHSAVSRYSDDIIRDEADDFIAKCTQGDEFANGVLRHIEYFKGIVFLTASLYTAIDEAFRSRVRVHVPFTNLGFSARLLIWQNFIVRLRTSLTDPASRGGPNLPEAYVSEIELQRLARWELNGREIKNIVKTSFVNCAATSQPLNYERLETGIKFTSPFAKRDNETETFDVGLQSDGATNTAASSKDPESHKRRIACLPILELPADMNDFV